MFIVILMLVSWIMSTFFLQSLLSSWGPRTSSSWSWASACCCRLEDDDEDLEDEVENIKKAFTVSDTMVSAVSNNDLHYDYSSRSQSLHNDRAATLLQVVVGGDGGGDNEREMVTIRPDSMGYSEAPSVKYGNSQENGSKNIPVRRSHSNAKQSEHVGRSHTNGYRYADITLTSGKNK